MTKRKFQVGDRVAVYDDGRRIIATVQSLTAQMGKPGTIIVINEELQIFPHVKQCRRLKPKAKKEPREIWINWDPSVFNERSEKFLDNILSKANGTVSTRPKEGWLRFVRAEK